MKKIQNIQALRGIAVLAVVLFHTLIIEQKYGGANAILPGFFQFGMIGVDLFFVISGFVMVTVTQGKFQNLKESLRFIYHRMARIYPSYWLFTILLLMIYFIHPTWINNAQGNQVDILSSFLLLPSHTLPLVTVGWTLIHEVYFYLIFFLILLLTPEKRLTLTIILWAVCVSLLNLYFYSSSPVMHVISHPLTLEFIGGCLIAIIYFKNDIKINNGILFTLATLSVAVSLAGFLYYQNTTELVLPLGWWRVIIFGLPALIIVYCFTLAERNGYVLHSSLILVGNISYSIYLSHLLTLSAFGRIWSLFSTDTVFDNVVIVPILLILVLIIGFLSYSMIEKPLLKLSRKVGF